MSHHKDPTPKYAPNLVPNIPIKIQRWPSDSEGPNVQAKIASLFPLVNKLSSSEPEPGSLHLIPLSVLNTSRWCSLVPGTWARVVPLPKLAAALGDELIMRPWPMNMRNVVLLRDNGLGAIRGMVR